MSDPMTAAVPDPTVEAGEAFANVALSVWSNTCNAYCCEQDATHAPECHLAATLYHDLAEHTERAVREALEAAAVRVEAAGLGADFGRQYDGNESPDAALHHAYDEGLQEAARIVREGGRP